MGSNGGCGQSVSTNLPYASQAQGPGSPCFSRGAEQPFPWGDLEFPFVCTLAGSLDLGSCQIHLCLGLVLKV